MPELKLIESHPIGCVEVYVDGRFVGRHSEYRGAAQYLERTYPEQWAAEHQSIYRAYREDYDER